MPIRSRISATQTVIPDNVIKMQEAAERLEARASDHRGVVDPTTDVYVGSWMDNLAIPPEIAKPVARALAFDNEQPRPNEIRVHDMLANVRLMDNPGFSIEKTYRKRVRSPLTAIRGMCVACKDYSPKAATKCKTVDCPLWPFRTGRNRLRGMKQLPDDES